MKPIRAILPILLALAVFNQVAAQTEEAAIKEVIQTMFDGMREGDSSKVHSVFIDKVIMQTIAQNPQGQVMLKDGSLQNFLNSVGTPHDVVYDERVLSYKINVDGPMATVWTPYEFYAGERFSHCGVNSFQLLKQDSGWKIIYLIDTRRKEGCK